MKTIARAGLIACVFNNYEINADCNIKEDLAAESYFGARGKGWIGDMLLLSPTVFPFGAV